MEDLAKTTTSAAFDELNIIDQPQNTGGGGSGGGLEQGASGKRLEHGIQWNSRWRSRMGRGNEGEAGTAVKICGRCF